MGDWDRKRVVLSCLTLALEHRGWGRIISWPEGCCALWHCYCVGNCVHELDSVSASGTAMFHLVNITQPATRLYRRRHHYWQLAGDMLLQLLCFGPQRGKKERKKRRREMRWMMEITLGLFASEKSGGEGGEKVKRSWCCSRGIRPITDTLRQHPNQPRQLPFEGQSVKVESRYNSVCTLYEAEINDPIQTLLRLLRSQRSFSAGPVLL